MNSRADLDFLTSAAGSALLDRLAESDLHEANTLSLLTALRKTHTPEQAAAALSLARLRLKARDKFGDDAARLYFTGDGLQQASDPLVRAYRARILREQGVTRMIDAGCGIGADSLALAAAGIDVLGLDIDALRVAIARENAAALDLPNAQFAVADLRDGLPGGYDAVFFDPARRDDTGRRIYDVNRYVPPLPVIKAWEYARVVVKLSPGVDVAQLADYGGGVEFVSVRGDLKEALLWRVFDGGSRATLLDDGTVYHYARTGAEPAATLAEPRGWLLEPDAALIRAGLVRDLAAEIGAAMLDESIAYLTSYSVPESPWVRAWHIQDWMPFNLKKLRAYLRERDVGRVTVKKRGSPLTPEALMTKLKLKGEAARTLVLTRGAGQPVVIVCAEQPV